MQLERLCKQREEEAIQLRDAALSLQQALDERATELESLRKKINRDATVNGLHDPSKTPVLSSPSKDLAAAKEEIKSHKDEIKGHK